MAIRWYRPKAAGTELELYIDPQNFVQSEDQAALAAVQEIEAASDAVRTELAICKGFASLAEYDNWLRDQRWELQDRLDYYSYVNRTEQTSVRDGAWFLPEAVNDVCGEETGNESGLSIDGNSATFWQHNVNHAHQITFKLRDWPKKMSKIRLRRFTNARSALEDVTVQVANSIPGLGQPENEAVTGASISLDDDWNEIVFTTKQRGIYIRLTGFISSNTNNESRIREIEAWVETRDP